MKKNHFKSILGKQKGQSLVELAVTISLLITLLIGVVDMGMAMYTWITIRDAAQEGAVYGSIYHSKPTTSGTPAYVINVQQIKQLTVDSMYQILAKDPSLCANYNCIHMEICLDANLNDGINPVCTDDENMPDESTASSAYNYPLSVCANGVNYILVDVTYNYQMITPFLSTLFGRNYIPIHAQVINTIVYPLCD